MRLPSCRSNCFVFACVFDCLLRCLSLLKSCLFVKLTHSVHSMHNSCALKFHLLILLKVFPTATNLQTVLMMMIWVSRITLATTNLVTFNGFLVLALADWITVTPHIDFVGVQTLDLEALKDSLQDLLDGLQVSWIWVLQLQFFCTLLSLFICFQ